MRTLSVLTAAAGILLAISGPSLAASRTQAQHKSSDAYSAYAYDMDNAFWPAPYIYAPNASVPYGSAYGANGRNPNSALGADRNGPARGPVGTIRNDW